MIQCDEAATLYWLWTALFFLWAWGFSQDVWTDMFQEWLAKRRKARIIRTVEARKARGDADYYAAPKDE